MSLYRKTNVALQNEHMTGTEKNGNKNVALGKSNVARKNEYITKSQENEEKMSLAMSLTMSLANVAHKRPTQNHCHNPNKKAVHTYCLWGWYIKGKPGVKEINIEGGFLYLTQA